MHLLLAKVLFDHPLVADASLLGFPSLLHLNVFGSLYIKHDVLFVLCSNTRVHLDLLLTSVFGKHQIRLRQRMRLVYSFILSFLELFVDCPEFLEHLLVIILVAPQLLNDVVLGVRHDASRPV